MVMLVRIRLLVFRANFYIILEHRALIAAQERLRVERLMLSRCLRRLRLPDLLIAVKVHL